MSREKVNYRDQLEALRDIFPGRVSVTVPEAAKAVGACTKTISREIDAGHLPATTIGNGKINKRYIIAISALARWSAGGL